MNTLGLRICQPSWLAPALIAATLAALPVQAAGPAATTAPSLKTALNERAPNLVQRALAYEHGEGVPRDVEKAVELYCEAARLGDVNAMYALGWMYANGRGLERNDAYAGTLFAMAAFLGHTQARHMTRFTGYTGDLPACLSRARRAPLPSSEKLLNAEAQPRFPNEEGWDADTHIRALPTARQEIARLVVELAANYEISPRLALAIAITESALNPLAVSPKYAMGVMQLIPDTAARFNVKNLLDPRENIKGGLAYLRWLLAYFRGDVALAAAAYNAGEGAVERYGGVPPYRETQAYVERVLKFVGEASHPFDSTVARPSSIFSRAILHQTVGEDDS